MIDPRRLRVLQALATSGSVVAAAASLHLTPPAVSQQLQALEREVGTPLVDRAGRQLALTAAGRLLAVHAERISAQLRQAESDLAGLTGRVTGRVRIAAFQSVIGVLVAPALRQLAVTHPAVRPVVVERYGPAVETALRLGDLDIVMTEYDTQTAEPVVKGCGLRRLMFDPYQLIVPPGWPAVVESVADLADRSWVAGPPGTACDQALDRLATESGVAPMVQDVCVEFPSVLALVAAGRGAAIVPNSTLAASVIGDAVTRTRARIGGRQIAAFYRKKNNNPDPATRTVLNTLGEMAATALER
ncbi:LysR family transcriptional regulator [Fodinicola feengrottensis]|uniref:LysR family transcriptional regulator n=1 Tax=Fodinicola feengrottensis TaxID=435914 RepID=A0ABN2GJM8_9ACTN|nr:LysR family transcriptional regulator [Fodinicola feengrottensis]